VQKKGMVNFLQKPTRGWLIFDKNQPPGAYETLYPAKSRKYRMLNSGPKLEGKDAGEY